MSIKDLDLVITYTDSTCIGYAVTSTQYSSPRTVCNVHVMVNTIHIEAKGNITTFQHKLDNDNNVKK